MKYQKNKGTKLQSSWRKHRNQAIPPDDFWVEWVRRTDDEPSDYNCLLLRCGLEAAGPSDYWTTSYLYRGETYLGQLINLTFVAHDTRGWSDSRTEVELGLRQWADDQVRSPMSMLVSRLSIP
jgi:hypothetical protein